MAGWDSPVCRRRTMVLLRSGNYLSARGNISHGIATLRSLGMNEQQILQQLQPVFREVFDNPALQVGPDDSGYTVDGWDSLTHINLVRSIERAFKIRFALGELQEL